MASAFVGLAFLRCPGGSFHALRVRVSAAAPGGPAARSLLLRSEHRRLVRGTSKRRRTPIEPATAGLRDPNLAKWVRIESVIGGETRGMDGYRRDAKLEVRRRINRVGPGGEARPIGLENRLRGDPYVGSNPTPPAIYLRLRRRWRLWWGRIGATLGGFGWLRRPSAGSGTAAPRREHEAAGLPRGVPTVRRDRCRAACR